MKKTSLWTTLTLALTVVLTHPVMANQTPPAPSSSGTPQALTSPNPAPQNPAAPNPAAPVQPWVSSCRGEGAARVCDTVQSLVETGTQREVVRIAFAKQKTTGRIGILIKTPLGLRLDTGAMLRLNGETRGSVEGLVYSRCLADGCYAEKPLTTAEINRIKNARSIDILLLNLQGAPATIPITITGLNRAIDGL